ncbi:MAG: exo-alpha-sialidase, partial [Clostridia bacterium]|nr:exo-alpha-sialidase [Clostridia bacterium]
MNAGTAANVVFRPKEKIYTDEHIREYQGCPTIATTRKGRIFLGWYSGGATEPHIDNFNILSCSDDFGKTWRQVLVIPGSRAMGIHALDIQLWTAPDGSLYVYWV